MTTNECGLADELFTHIAHDAARTQTTYNVSALLRHVAAGRRIDETFPDIVKIPVEEHQVEFLVANRGIERERIQALVANPKWLMQPIVFIHLADDSHLLVDGMHRYTTFYMLGAPQILALIIEADVAAPFIIEDFPHTDEEMLMADRSVQLARALGLVGGPEPS